MNGLFFLGTLVVTLLRVSAPHACLETKTNEDTQPLEGRYRLRYEPPLDNMMWDFDLIWREEALHLKPDSTFVLKRIYPQGGFEVLPQVGRWKVEAQRLILKPAESADRIFNIGHQYVSEIRCAERDDLSGVHWIKEK